MGRCFVSVCERVKCIADRCVRSSRALRFSREPVKIAILQDSGAMQRCLASLYYSFGKSGDNKKEGVFLWYH